MISQRSDPIQRVFRAMGLVAFALLAGHEPARCATRPLIHALPAAVAAPQISSGSSLPNSAPFGEAPLPVFELHSGFWLNLHHFLYLQARLARGNTAPTANAVETASSAQSPVSLAGFSTEEVQAWQAALTFYGRDLATRDLTNSDMEVIRNRLSELEACADLAGNSSPTCNSGLPPELVDILDRAAPVYRRHWWTEQDRANRQWIAAVAPMIQQMGEQLSEQLASVYEKLWPLQKMRVDVVWYAGTDGAYTASDPVRLTISSNDARNQGLYGFEVLFHEASYAVAGPLNEVIAREFRQRDKLIPRDLWEALLFYTTSEMIQRDINTGSLRLDTSVTNGRFRYQPYGERFGLYAGPWRRFHDLLDLYWRPYLEGEMSYQTAIARMASAQ